ncbi:hypothetical protein FQZ97_829290 [compost metagenome]
MAPTSRPRRAHALLGRLPLAAPGCQPLCAADRRPDRARRAGKLPRRTGTECRRGVLLRPAGALDAAGKPLPALPACPGARNGPRHSRPAADRQRRLERRHEPDRRPGSGRKRLAGLLPARGAGAVRGHRTGSWRCRLFRTLQRTGRGTARKSRAARLGWRLVSTGLLRRWLRPGFGLQRRMPNRLHCPELVSAFGRSLMRAAAPGDGLAVRAPGAPRFPPDPTAYSTFRPFTARPRLYQGLCPRCA